jgi:hypothetical protein
VLLAAYGHDDLAAAIGSSTGPAHALLELDVGAALARRSGLLAEAENIELIGRSEFRFALVDGMR